MIVYCDTSFLFSFLNEDDVNHATARGQRHTGPWLRFPLMSHAGSSTGLIVR